MSPYRESQKLGAVRPAELAYVPQARMDQRAGCLPAFELAGLPTAAGSVLFLFGGNAAGAVGFALALAFAVWRWNRRRKPGVLLRVEHGELRVHPRGSKEPLVRLALSNLEDVVLDTKTVERVEGGDPNLGAVYMNVRITPPTDTNRILLQPREGDPVPLTEEFLGHADTVEWFGKIRVFLRRSGWTPASERQVESALSPEA